MYPFPLHEIEFSDNCPTLPSDRGDGFPHIVDLSRYDCDGPVENNLSCADGVATFLWNWDKKQFDCFFDLKEEDFEVH